MSVIASRLGRRLFEVTFIDSGRTFRWTLDECQEHFGKAEFKEYLAGYLPHVVVVEVTTPPPR